MTPALEKVVIITMRSRSEIKQNEILVHDIVIVAVINTLSE